MKADGGMKQNGRRGVKGRGDNGVRVHIDNILTVCIYAQASIDGIGKERQGKYLIRTSVKVYAHTHTHNAYRWVENNP